MVLGASVPDGIYTHFLPHRESSGWMQGTAATVAKQQLHLNGEVVLGVWGMKLTALSTFVDAKDE